MSAAECYVAWWHSSCGVRTVLARPGRARLSLVLIDGAGVTARAVPLTEERHCTRLDQPIGKAARSFRAAGRRLGMTKAARQMLRSLS